ncbi:MAG: DinB family protein [Candidatus Kariarchaeaceae archaeon]|jgi:hypothetical protein
MVLNVSDLALPLKNYLGYIKYILSKRNEFSDIAFQKLIPGDTLTPLDLWYHGTNNLYRAARHIFDPEMDFSSINQERIVDLKATDETVELFTQANNDFEDALQKISAETLEKEIKSPISGNTTTLKSWIATNIMHTIGHLAQALRFQGIISRELGS